MLVLCAPQSVCGETTRTDTGSFSPVGQSVSEEMQLEQTQGHSHLWVKVSVEKQLEQTRGHSHLWVKEEGVTFVPQATKTRKYYTIIKL